MRVTGLSLIVLAAASASTALASPPVTKVRFIDGCTNDVTGVTTPKGKAKLRIDLEGLAPNAKIYLDVLVAPADGPDESNGMHEDHIKKRNGAAGSDGHFSFERRIRFAKGHSLFKVRVNWTQPGQPLMSGGGGTAIQVITDSHQTFYELQGGSLCAWETPWSISSEHYHNDSDTQLMDISRNVVSNELQDREKGVDLGIMPDMESNIPVASPTGTILGKDLINKHIKNPLVGNILAENYGWIYHENKDTQKETREQTIQETWPIAPHQGGYFATKLSFRRFPVIEYALVKDQGSCAKWKVTRTGYMDAGIPVENFFVVPDDLTAEPAKSQQFIEAFEPSVNTCNTFSGLASGAPPYRVAGDKNGLLFFYPQE